MSSANVNNGLVSSSWQEWTTRLQAYVAWLNSQLRKQQGCRKINDLRNDLQDGVVISQLVEALGGEKVIGIDINPTSPASRKENVERIFQYFLHKKVPLANCKAKDVLAGDLKSIMRLIHAVASHYRPDTVLNPPSSSIILTTQQHRHRRCASSLDNNAFSSMSSQTAKPASSSLGRPRPSGSVRKVFGGSALPIRKQPLSSREYPKLSSTFPSLSSEKDKTTPFRKSLSSLNSDRVKTTEADVSFRGSTPKISCKVAPLQYPKGLTPILHTSGNLPNTKLGVKKKQFTSRSEPCSLDSVEVNSLIDSNELKKIKECSCSSLNEELVVQLLNDVKETKALLFLLQDTLLHGNNGKFMNDSEHGVPYGCTDDPDNITTRQLLRDPVSVDNKCVDKSSRSTEPLSMVKKLISYVSVCGERKSMDFEETPKPNSQNCDPPDITKNKKENEILRKLIAEKEQEIKNLKLTLSNIGSGYEKKIKYPYLLHSRTQREELQVVHEALTSLRKCFPANDPYQHTLDTIEQSLSALLERVNSLEIGAVTAQQPSTTTEVLPGAARRSTFEHSLESRKNTSHSLPFSHRIEAEQNSTKVVYYMDKSVTPFRCVLNKRIGEANLRDFKLLFDRPGQYRYHFKTLDPEFGMVKEEVLHDEDILPGWDGKVIAWIEEDCS